MILCIWATRVPVCACWQVFYPRKRLMAVTGDPSLTKRPMERVAAPLRDMGAKIQTTGKKGTPPISITGNQPLQGITYQMPMASAQVKSCLLLAGRANGKTTVIEPEISRDHTERMLSRVWLCG